MIASGMASTIMLKLGKPMEKGDILTHMSPTGGIMKPH